MLYQFGDLLRSVELPLSWREVIAERCTAEVVEDDNNERVRLRRAELEAEQQRLITLYTKGYISEDDLDKQIEGIRHQLFTLPVPVSRDVHEVTQAAISAGETLVSMSDYWSEATIEERRDMVWSLLMIEGLIYDLERRTIIGLLPRADVLPVLELGLESTAQWEQGDNGLWLRSEYLPDRRDQRDYPHFPPPQAPSLTPLQQYEARLLIEQGYSMRQVAKHFGVSHGAIWRLMHKDR